jgi:putative flippase GtrA
MAKVTRLKRQPLGQLVREFVGYTAASAVALAADLATLVFLVEQGVHYLTAATVAFLIGLGIVYLASVRWIFGWRSYGTRPHLEIGFFLFTGAVGLVMNLAIMWVGVDVLGLWYLIPKAISVGFTFTWNFVSRKLMLFTPHHDA